jgi:hypothetical protein
VGTNPAVAEFRDVAVVAKDLEVGREAVLDDPSIHVLGPSERRLIAPMLVPVVVDVIEGQHRPLRLSATHAPITAVVLKHLIPKRIRPYAATSVLLDLVLVVALVDDLSGSLGVFVPSPLFLRRILRAMAGQADMLPILLSAKPLAIDLGEIFKRLLRAACPASSNCLRAWLLIVCVI